MGFLEESGNLPVQRLEQITDEEFWQYARARADEEASDPPSGESSHPDQYLECELRRGNCLVPLHTIEEVVAPPHRIALLPLTPLWMPGVAAWRGETIAVVNLDMYLSGIHTPSSGGFLLITRHTELIIGLYVPAVGLTTTIEFEQVAPSIGSSMLYTPTRAGVVKGVYAEVPILDVPALLSDVTQQIGMAAYHV
jgi:chemotaxis signal transduction protein